MDKYTHIYNVTLDDINMYDYKLSPNSAILYIQDAFSRYCATKKLSAFDLFDKHIFWVLAEFNIKLTDSFPFWSKEVEAKIWFSEITKLKIFIDFELKYDGKTFLKGDGIWFLVDEYKKRPIPADIIKESFKICPEYSLLEHKRIEFPNSDKKIGEFIYNTDVSDLDFNHHVNNKVYMKIAENSFGEEFKKLYTLKSISVRFNKEAFLNENLSVMNYEISKNSFLQKIIRDNVSICDILSSYEKR